jgi:Ca2+-binding EF-hand superfamily protein
MESGGLFSREQCRQVARKMIEYYDGNNDGIVDSIEMGKMLVDCYRGMNRQYQPTATEISSYVRVLDRQGRGKISFEDLDHYIATRFSNPTRA